MMPLRTHDANRARTTPGRTNGGSGVRTACALVLFAAMSPILTACALTEHTIEPYRSDRVAAVALEARAAISCRDVRTAAGSGTLPKRAFRTDGCSAWPDSSSTQPCCVEHDIDYWCGGPSSLRLAADDAFGECVRERSGSSALGWMMRLGVRMGGHPFFPMPYRWGYGDDYAGGYTDPPRSEVGDAGAEDACAPARTATPIDSDRRRRAQAGTCPDRFTRSADPPGCP